MVGRSRPPEHPEPIGRRAVLEEQRRALEGIQAACERTDNKLQNLFLGTGFQITLAAGIRVAVLGKQLGSSTWLYFAGAIGVYLVMFLVLFLALRPQMNIAPISRKWEVFSVRYFDKSEDQVLDGLIVDYQEAIDLASEIGVAKALGLDIAMFLFVVTLGILLAALWLS